MQKNSFLLIKHNNSALLITNKRGFLPIELLFFADNVHTHARARTFYNTYIANMCF